jgi:hypothetical protein
MTKLWQWTTRSLKVSSNVFVGHISFFYPNFFGRKFYFCHAIYFFEIELQSTFNIFVTLELYKKSPHLKKKGLGT